MCAFISVSCELSAGDVVNGTDRKTPAGQIGTCFGVIQRKNKAVYKSTSKKVRKKVAPEQHFSDITFFFSMKEIWGSVQI